MTSDKKVTANVGSIEDILSPKGSNKLSASKSFYWRSLYKEFIAPAIGNSVDMWYDDTLYGKVDSKGVAAYPFKASLRQLKGKNTIYAVGFVAYAWEEFRSYVNKSTIASEISKNSFYATLEPKVGWKSYADIYNNWNSSVYKIFATKFMTPEHDKKIKNFEDFINVYLEFVNTLASSIPQTTDSLILSNRCSPMISGLFIDIAEGAHDYDLIKAKLLQDESYERVAKIAKHFGFKTDRNAPWRFIADLESDRMKSYMSSYNLFTKQDVYDLLYEQTYINGLTAFQRYLVKWYSIYIIDNPLINKTITKSCDGSTIPIVQKRIKMSITTALEQISEEYWIRLYAYVRAKETRKSWKQPKFDRVVNKAINLSKIKNPTAAMRYLYKEIEGNRKKNHFLRNDYTREEISAILKERSLNRDTGNFKF